MDIRKAMQYCLEKSLALGMQNAQCVAQHDETEEIIAFGGEMSCANATTHTTLHLTGIFDLKHAVISVNSLEPALLEQALNDLFVLAKASKPDPAQAIADYQPPQEIERGLETPDRELMYARFAEFLAYCKAAYPSCVQRATRLKFIRSHTYVQNSNGVDLAAHQGAYRFHADFSAQNDSGTAMFNAAAFASAHLDQELRTLGAVDRQIRQTIEQLDAAPLTEKFTGDVILAPESVGNFIALLADQLSDQAMIAGTSIFRHRFREIIAAQKLTLHSQPLAEEIMDSALVTPDGYLAQNSTIIGNGVLNTLLLSQYAARLLQKRRALNHGGAYVIDAGGTPFDTMIASTRKGVLVGSFLPGALSGNGDFYGVAPICAFVKDGAAQRPLQHIIIAGNLADALQEIRFVSRERADFGHAIFPWLQMRNLTIIGQ